MYYDEATGKWHRESISGSPYMAEELGVEVSTIVRNKKRLCLKIYEQIE